MYILYPVTISAVCHNKCRFIFRHIFCNLSLMTCKDRLQMYKFFHIYVHSFVIESTGSLLIIIQLYDVHVLCACYEVKCAVFLQGFYQTVNIYSRHCKVLIPELSAFVYLQFFFSVVFFCKFMLIYICRCARCEVMIYKIFGIPD